MANKRGFTVALNTINDVYMVETNFVSDGQNIFALIPIPLFKPEKLVDVHRYPPSPLALNNTDRHLVVRPEKTIIAINNDRSLYNTFDENELGRCKRLDEIYWCAFRQIMKKSYKPN